MRSRWPTPWLLLPVAGLAFTWRTVLSGEQLFLRDLSRTYLPLKRFIADAFAQGVFPEWWPHNSLGMPLVATTLASLFHPTTLFFAVLPFRLAFALYVLTAVVTAVAGAFRLARALGLHAEVAVVVATVYSLCGWVVSIGEQPFTFLAAGMLPWVWWAVLRARKRTRAVIALAFVFGLFLLCGDPFQAYTAVLSCVALALTSRARRLHALLRVGCGLGLGGMVAMAQWLPVALFLGEASRGHEGAVVTNDIWSFTPTQARALVVSDAVIDLNSYFPSLYVGVPVFALALLALRSRTKPWVWWALAAGSTWLACGYKGGLWRVFAWVLPGFSGLRYPLKALLVGMLALAVLAGFGVRELARLRREKWWPRAALAVVLLDLLRANSGLHPAAPPGFFDTPRLATELRMRGVGSSGWRYRFDGTAKRGTWAEAPALELRAQRMLVPDRGALEGLPAFNSYLPAESLRYRELLDERGSASASVLAATSVKWVVSARDRSSPGNRVVLDDEREGWALSEVPGAVPHARVLFSSRVLPRQDVVAALRGGAFALDREVLLELEDTAARALTSSRPALEVPLVVDARGSRLEVTLEEPGYLVVNDAWFAGVEAFDDGRPLVVEPGNHAVRAVYLGPGVHRVELRYATPGLGAGVAISVCTVLTLLVLARRTRSRRTLSRTHAG